MSPVSSTETSRHRSSSTIESSLRTRCRSQSAAPDAATIDLDAVDRDAIAARRRSPSARRPPAPPARSARQRLEARHRNALPHLARPELAHDRRGAADVIGIAVRQRDVVEPPEAGVAQHRRDDAVADVERRRRRRARRRRPAASRRAETDERGVALPDVDERDVQPAVAARRDAASTARRESTTRRAGDRRPRRAAQPRLALPATSRRRHSAHADASRSVVHGDHDPRRRRDPAGQRRREARRDRPIAPGRRRRRARSSRRPPASGAETSAAGTTAMPGDLRHAPSAGSPAKFSASPANVTRENDQRADRKQHRLGRRPRPRASADRRQRRRTRAARRRDPRDRVRRPTTRIASVAPKVRTNAGSATDSGSAATRQRRHDRQRVERRAALIDRARAEVDDRHQRRAIDRRAAADQLRVREQRGDRRQHRGRGRASRRGGTRRAAGRRGSRCCRRRSRSRDTCPPPAAAAARRRRGRRDRR